MMEAEAQRVFLKFQDAVLEGEYQLDAARRTRQTYRVLWLLATLIFAAVGLVDRYTAGSADNLAVISRVRFLLALPLLLGVTSFGWASGVRFARYRQLAVAIGTLTMLGSPVLMLALVPHRFERPRERLGIRSVRRPGDDARPHERRFVTKMRRPHPRSARSSALPGTGPDPNASGRPFDTRSRGRT